MTKKMVTFLVIAVLALPFASLAQTGAAKSIESLSSADIADNSIIVLSTAETGVPGYVNQKYAFACFGELNLVDYYGPAFEANDRKILDMERSFCSRNEFGDKDTSDD
ncbi:MAG: hypothetical protein WCH75_23360 [Candidatus Binatia bacterium]